MKTFPLVTLGFALALSPAASFAAPNPYGLNAAWNQCWGDGGTSNRLFACNTNSGAELLVLSLRVDAPIANVSGVEMYLQFAAESASLPAWWAMHNTGTCRQTALDFVIQPPNPASTQCLDWGAGSFGAAGIGNYVIGGAGLNTVTTAAASAVPPGLGLRLDPGVEYFTGTYRISHAKTVGTGACGGCNVPMCLFFAKARIFVDSNPSPVRILTTSANTPNSQGATWQSGQFVNLVHNCDPLGNCATAFLCSTQPVSGRGNTWGAVKSLYR
jgi:hypothetical protein